MTAPRSSGRRYTIALKQADDREAELIRAFDADRKTFLARIAEVSRERKVSAEALSAVTLALGLELAKSGRPADLGTILAAIAESATRIEELERQLAILLRGEVPEVARLVEAAQTAIREGNLDAAERALERAFNAQEELVRLRETQVESGRITSAAVLASGAEVRILRADFLGAASLYSRAAETAPESARAARWDYRTGQALALKTRGEQFGEPAPLREAVRIYRDLALPLVPRSSAPAFWAATQNNLGQALWTLGQKGDDQALRDAITAFRMALEVHTRASAPAFWAQTQNNLGAALLTLDQKGDDQALREAITAFRMALEVHTRAAAPADWALTQNNLGIAFRILGERGDDQKLREAIAAFRAVLEVRTRASAPYDWAATQGDLGNALSVLGERGDNQAMREAVGAYRASLDVLTRASAPADWAGIQFNLALAHRAGVLRGDGAELAPALAAARAALAGFEQVRNRFGTDQARRLIAELEKRQ